MLICHLNTFFGEDPFRFFICLLIRLFIFLLLSFKNYLYILENRFNQLRLLQILSPRLWYPHSLDNISHKVDFLISVSPVYQLFTSGTMTLVLHLKSCHNQSHIDFLLLLQFGYGWCPSEAHVEI
jgi:hypothetical protein